MIVTGAGSGIGRATASRIAREGGRVVAVDISQERLDDFAAEQPGADIVTVAGDITDDGAIAAIVAAAGDRIDGLANIAGIMDDMTPVREVSRRGVGARVLDQRHRHDEADARRHARDARAGVRLDREHRVGGGPARLRRRCRLHGVEARRRRHHQEQRLHVRPERHPRQRRRPRPDDHEHRGDVRSELGAERVQLAMTVLPDAAEADALAASITFLLSDDGVNVNGVILPSDGGWSVACRSSRSRPALLIILDG